MNKKHTLRVTPLLAALAGMGFCIAAGLGLMEEFCFTEGCSVTRLVKLFGYSLWWWGAGAFAGLAALIAAGRLTLAFWLNFACVAVDALLLAWLAFTSPCLTCLLAGLIFILLYFLVWRAMDRKPKAARALVAVWFFAFSPNFFATMIESVDPWPIFGSQRAGSYLYFSPTCPACHDTILYLKQRLQATGRPVAFYPVARNRRDLEKIKVMIRGLGRGSGFFQAYDEAARTDVFAGPWGISDELRLRIRLFRNQIALTRTGSPGVPVMVSRGGIRRTRPKPPASAVPGRQPGPPGDNTP